MPLSPPPDLILKMEIKPPSNRIPQLPELPIDTALQVFTDVSLRPHDNGSRRADNEVLSVLGQSACSTVLTSILCSRKPALSAEEIITARDEWMTEAAMINWVNYYKDSVDKVRCLPGTTLSADILIRTWYAYLGGIHLIRGHHVLDQFLRQVVDPSTDVCPPSTMGHNHSSSTTSNSGAHAKSDGQGQYISMLHVAAAKRGSKIEYDMEPTGPQHALKWTVTVLVDGEWKAQGYASSKQTAKEEAAKAAFNALHWG